MHLRCPAAATSVRTLVAVTLVAVTTAEPVDQGVAYIWPTVLWSVPSLGDDFGDAAPFARLVEVARRGFEHYVNTILPQELQIDPSFAREFHSTDASRLNLAFLRWQKRVYSAAARVPVEELDWDGKPVPRLPGISYKWPELYESRELKVLTQRVSNVASSFLNSLEREKHKHKFRAFLWAEVYRPGDFLRPHMHTGAAVAGMFFARCAARGGQTLVFEDSRGATPPFGRTFVHTPAQGELLLWPAWAPHFLTPHSGNSTNVFFSFLLWPPNGARDFDWEDDVTGDYVYRKTSSVKPQKRAKGREEHSVGRQQEL